MNPLKQILFWGLCLLLIASSPAFANDDSDDNTGRDDTQVYHIYDDVDLVSTLKYQYSDKPKYTVKSVYPQLSSDNNNANADHFNQLVLNIIKEEVTDFRNKAKETQKFLPENTKPSPNNSLYIDYNTSAIKSGDQEIISVRFTIQGFLAGMNHPYHHHRSLNYDVYTGEEIDLSDLFKPDEDYLSIFSDYTSDVLMKQLANKQMVLDGTTSKPENYMVWNLKPNGVVITFEEYQVAPYVNGAQTVLVPFSVLKPMLAADSPLSDCIKHKSRCRSENLLTGGFID